MEVIKKTLNNLLEMKIKRYEIKNSLDKPHGLLEVIKQKISKYKNISIETIEK